jgi:spermidine synthase
VRVAAGRREAARRAQPPEGGAPGRGVSALSLLVLFCFFFSGLASLVYQILWQRMIDKVVGSAPFAVAIVLSVFMGGLALGSWLAGRYIDRIASRRQLLLLYGIVELGIGMYGLLLPLLIHIVKPAYVLAYDALFAQSWLYRLFTFLGCSLLLAVPTTLMGVTLPLLCRFYVQHLRHIGARTGLLYGINTIGGAAGAALCGFLLIARFGVWGSILIAASLNGIIAALCVWAAKTARPLFPAQLEEKTAQRELPPQAERGEAAVPRIDDRWIAKSALWIFGISGFSAMAYEVFWTRLLGLILGPTTYSFSLVVSTFIVGLALGNILFGWLADKVKETFRLLLLTQACAGCLALLVSQFLGNSQFFFSKLIHTFQADFEQRILIQSTALFFVLIGPTIFLGGSFPLVSRIYARSLPEIGRDIGTAYAVNTTGAILGSFAAGFLLIPVLGKEDGLRLTAGLQLFGALLPLAYGLLRAGPRIRQSVAGVVTLLAGALLVVNVPSWNHSTLSRGWYYRFESFDRYFATTSWFEAFWTGTAKFARHLAGREVVFYGDGIGGFTAVERWRSPTGQVNYTLLNSGKEDASSHGDRLTQSLGAHVPLLLHPDPHKVMILGLASGMTAGEALLYPVDRLDVLEINDQAVKAAELFNPWNNGCLSNPRTRIIVQDGRNHLELTKERYDVIISEPSNPWMAGMANVFTRDYFETAKARLTKDGIFVQWIHSYDMDWPTFAMVGRTFGDVFPEGLLMRMLSSDFLLVGFAGPRVLDARVVDSKGDYSRQSSNVVLRNPRVIFDLILTDDLKGLFGPGPLHTDDWPRLEFAAPKSLGKSDPAIEISITGHRSLSPQTRAIVQSNRGVDSSLNTLELLTADFSPPFGDVDLRAATPAQAQRYAAIVRSYCQNEHVPEYSVVPRDDLRKECAALQRARIEAHVTSHPDDAGAYFYLARADRVLGDTAGAVNALQRAISRDSSFHAAHLELGNVLAKEGRLDDAARRLSDALTIKPDSVETYIDLGNVLLAQGNVSSAIDQYSRALRIDPASARAHTNLGIVLADQGKTAEAIDHFERALQLDPGSAEAHGNLANLLRVEGKTDEAIQHYSKALELQPNNARTHYGLGQLYAGQGRAREALTEFREALKINENDADTQSYVGMILSQMGERDAAIAHLEAALRVDSNHFSARYSLGVALLQRGKVEEATGHFRKAIELRRHDPQIYRDVGIVMGESGRLKESARYLKESLERDPRSAATHDSLGVTLARMGRMEEAVGHFREALAIDGSFEAARAHLRIVEGAIGSGRAASGLSRER